MCMSHKKGKIILDVRISSNIDHYVPNQERNIRIACNANIPFVESDHPIKTRSVDAYVVIDRHILWTSF